MTNTLEVIKPFFVAEEGDIFERNDNGFYECKESSTYSDDEDGDTDAYYHSSYSISESYAETLVDAGYLKEKTEDKPFVNVFDEIDRLSYTYSKELEDVKNDAKSIPACLRVERETVLTNLITVLDHLKTLKK